LSSIPYTRQEEERVLASLRAGKVPTCPRCGGPLERRDVSPGEGVPYVRNRVWFSCASCRRGVVVDRRRAEETEP